MTFLFCDLVASTAIMSQLGDERNEELRRDLFDVLRQPIDWHRGFEVKSQGDGLMVSFSVTPGDALRCATAMHRGVARLSKVNGGPELALRSGISGGTATYDRGDWYGTAVVEAARLCNLARSGQILVADHAVTPGEGVPRLASVGALPMKGFPAPVPAAEVLWTQAEPTNTLAPLLPSFDRWGLPELVGTDTERMAELVDRVVSGDVRVVLVTGPPRSGRSTFVREAVRRVSSVSARPSTVVHAQGRSRTPLATSVSEGLDYLRRWLPPHLGARVNRGPLTESAPLDALARLASNGPTIVVIDDFELADVDSVPLLVDLAGIGIPGLRIFVALRDHGSSMAEEVAVVVDKIASIGGTCRIELGPLEDAAVDQLVLEAGILDGDSVVAAGLTAQCGRLVGDVVDGIRHLEPVRPAASASDLVRSLSKAVPYKGLVPLDEADGELFFGRIQLVDRVTEQLTSDRFVAVVGASGSGKSSILRAGVVPALASRDVQCVVLTPSTSDDFERLAPLPPDVRGVVLDQFEEVFTLWPPDRRRPLLDSLCDLIMFGDVDCVAVAIRSDFFGSCAEHDRFSELIGGRVLLVGSPSEADLRVVVERPAEVAGLLVEAALVDRVIADVRGEEQPLPLLAHALRETWRRRRGPRLTIDDYAEAGGLRGAMARTADHVFTMELSAAEQEVARVLLLRMTGISDHGAFVRRPLPEADVQGLFGDTARPVIERLVAARLVVVQDDDVQLAHEALIDGWPRLNGWLTEDRERLRQANELNRAAEAWEAAGCGDSDLLRGERLEGSVALMAGGHVATRTEQAFVDASVERRDRERNDLRRTNRRLRRQLIGAITALALAAGATGVALVQRNRADADRRVAELAALPERVRELSQTRIDTASLIAVEASRLGTNADGLTALETALRAQPAISRVLNPAWMSPTTRVVGSNADGGRVALYDDKDLSIIDAGSLRTVSKFTRPGLLALDLSADATKLAAADATNLYILDSAHGSVEMTLPLRWPTSDVPARVAWADDTKVWIAGKGFALLIADTGRRAVSVGPVTGAEPAVAADPTAGSVALLHDVASGAVGIYSAAGEGPTATVDLPPDQAFQLETLALRSGQLLAGGSAGATELPVDGGSPLALPVQRPRPTSAIFGRGHDLILTINDVGEVKLIEPGAQPPLRATASDPTARDGFVDPASGRAYILAGDHVDEIDGGGNGPIFSAPFGGRHIVPMLVDDAGRVSYLFDASSSSVYVFDPRTWRRRDDWPVPQLLSTWPQTFIWSDTAVLAENFQSPELAVDGPHEARAFLVIDFGQFPVLVDGNTVTVMKDDGSDITDIDLRQRTSTPNPTQLAPIENSVFAASSTGALLARTAPSLYAVELYDLKAGKGREEPSIDLPPGLADVVNMAFSSDNRRLAVATSDGDIGVLDIDSGRFHPRVYRGLSGRLDWMGYAKDDLEFFATSADTELRWWDARSGHPVGDPIQASAQAVSDAHLARANVDYRAIAPSNSATTIMIVGDDGVQAWNFDFASWPQLACARAGRNMTRTEWSTYMPPGFKYHVTCPQYAAG